MIPSESLSPKPVRRYFVKCFRCRLIHVHGWAHHCPKAPDLTLKHPALSALKALGIPGDANG